MDKLMNRLIDKLMLKKMMRKAIRKFSWAVGVSLIVSLLMGGVAAYGIPYKGLDMPIYIHSNEEINGPELFKENNKFLEIKDILEIRDKRVILKAVLGYLGQGARIGRGPPMHETSHLIEFSLIERKNQNIKDLLVIT